jgi:hypothetical protein
MAIREGRWDCASCGRAGNRGPERYCTGCGAPRGADVRFYLPPDAAEVTDAVAVAAAKVGPDWTCGYCGSDNRGSGAFCTQCGAGQDGSAPRPVVDHPIAPPAPPAPVQALGPKKSRGKKGCLAVIVVLVALLALQSWCSRPREVELTPIAHSWVRAVEVQALKPVEEQGWEGEVPSNARVLSSRRELYRTERVQVGTRRESKTVTERVQAGTERVKTGSRDLGNGYFEDIYEDRPVYRNERRQVTETVPVYEDRKIYKNRLRYVITKWVTVRTETAKGSTSDLRWPDARLGSGEQLGAQTESLEVQLRDPKGRTFTYRVPNENDFRRLVPGRSLTGEIKSGEVKSLALDGR